ncbi:hypothetical protein [Pararhizobium antarcticum]|uniref:Lipoprotein n=1 Tax=Pararhizobium antarcticum TaxID=1798805 RepID=A0A657LRZ4_9HYPH|nr:hypothetical protein [Pararhizobium antarcticum]OJF96807.1 hypothetical protein AX760_02765 [Pararhizobium antarcticum]OJF98981.1 hypothetical protein AX761_12210 [Rhizobium sp. 58]
MQKLVMLLLGLGLVAALSGCNTTDALTPQVDVGDGTVQSSSPVNQADLDQMAQQQPVVTEQQLAPVNQTSAFSAQNTTPAETALARADATYTNPAGTLDAQAGQLQQGSIPAQVTQPAESATEQEMPQQQQTTVAAVSPAAATGTIRFLPIIGAPVQAVTPLSKQLGAEARAKGLTIKGAADPTSRHILKGYFSAFKDGDQTTVVYVWDVLDNSGNRLHRIQGQDTVAGAAADLWSAVPATTMQGIATRSIEAYLSWSQSNPG